jgi:hypothetical protein
MARDLRYQPKYVQAHMTCNIRGASLLVTCRDESIPPCRRVSDTSRRHRGRQLLLWLVHLGFHSGFPLWVGNCPFFKAFLLLLLSHHCRSILLNASLLVVVFTLSGKRFQLSTTLTGNEYFLTSVLAYWAASPCAAAALLVLTLLSASGMGTNYQHGRFLSLSH